jgi:hypothetical protein
MDTKIYCTKPYQCVKCGGQHDSKDCTKPRHNPAKCALCGDDHPANYKWCTVHRNLVATRSNHPRVNNLFHQHPATHPNKQCLTTTPKWVTNNPYTPTLLTQTPPVHNGQYTYPQITKNNQTSLLEQPTLAEQLASFLNEFKAMFSQLLNQNSMILNLLTTVINKFNP